MRCSLLIALLSLFIVVQLSGQRSFDTQYAFQDGIYLSYDEFIHNKPSFRLRDVVLKEKNTTFFNKKKIKSIKYRDKYGKKQTVDLKTVWGICMKNVPYIQYHVMRNKRINVGSPKLEYVFNGDFTRIRILGNICHFNIEDIFTHSDGYFDANPYNLSDSKFVSIQKILKMETGEVRDFTPINLQYFIQDDKKLHDHYVENVDDREHKIFLYLQKYNERNPYSLTTSSINR